jgi:hypothetical protein
MVLTRRQAASLAAQKPKPARQLAPGPPPKPARQPSSKPAPLPPQVSVRRRRGARQGGSGSGSGHASGSSAGSAVFEMRELDLPLAMLPAARVSSGQLRRALSGMRERKARAIRGRAAALTLATKLGRRVRSALGDVVVPPSLRSRRAWSLREWSEHPASSPPEVERVDLLLFSNVRELFVKEMARALRGEVAKEAERPTSRASPPRPGLQRAYGVEVTSKGGFRGQHRALAEEAVRAAGPGAARLDPRAIGAALDRALAKVDERAQLLTQRRGYTLWEARQRRRQSAGVAGGAEFVTLAGGRRSRRVVGRSLLPYHLPEDLRAWLESLGLRYDPALNPRLRQRVRGLGTRPRFVWGYNRGLGAAKAQAFVDKLRAGSRIARARRNWAALHPEVMELRVSKSTDPAPSATKVLADAVSRAAKRTDASGHAAAAIYANFQTRAGSGHASLVLLGLRRGTEKGQPAHLLLRILDPHASDSLVTSATLAVLRRAATEAAARARLPLASLRIEVCAFKRGPLQRAMRVQYGKEGVCGPSAFALLLSALRQIATPARLWHKAFCDRAYGLLRIQDAVLVMQLIHRL